MGVYTPVTPRRPRQLFLKHMICGTHTLEKMLAQYDNLREQTDSAICASAISSLLSYRHNKNESKQYHLTRMRVEKDKERAEEDIDSSVS